MWLVGSMKSLSGPRREPRCRQCVWSYKDDRSILVWHHISAAISEGGLIPSRRDLPSSLGMSRS